jgi:predicted nucleic acid-binding protein
MSRIVLLDSGPLGMLARYRPDPALKSWVRALLQGGNRLGIPEIADYEVRRELLLARLQTSLNALNALQAELDYLQITTLVMRKAASLWAEARQQGVATADRHALDGDVILAANARLLIADGHDVVVATTNIGHLARFVPAQLWHAIS